MLSGLHLVSIFLFYVQLASALSISVPPAPVLTGTTVSVGWTATASDPLSFTLQLVCAGQVTLQDAVARGSNTNDTGQVSYLTGCLGDHFVQAVVTGSTAAPFATSASFQVVEPTTIFTTATEILTFTLTVLPNQSSSPPSSSSADSSKTSTDGRVRTLAIVSGLLGATTLVLSLLLIVLFLRLRKRPRNSQESEAPKHRPIFPAPSIYGSTTATSVTQGQFRERENAFSDHDASSQAGEGMWEVRGAHDGRSAQAVDPAPSLPPPYQKGQRYVPVQRVMN
ncbi:hypothetical protein MSAN_01093400 [Mycena sanguinolenta]|uniref:Uncharacterized protein n=1 Tax=Mycena sanguinolenta TaxID=230812 RepID=A0A8H7D9B8_9AGAR|nr:hypothetical protein MSAN_01093400 [Mycena sanguinolenta]